MCPCNSVLECLGLGRPAHNDELEQPALCFTHEKKQHLQTTQFLAEDILSTLYATDTNDEHLVQRLQEVVRETGWYESLAAAVLNGLENALKAGTPMGEAMKGAYEKAAQVVAAMWGFTKDHPVFCAFVALGILAILVPWAIAALGFGAEGVIEGTTVVVDVQEDILMRRFNLFVCRNLRCLVADDI
jgi:hypothetical protein